MKTLQNKIFLFFVLLLLMVQAIAFLTLYNVNKNQEATEINNRLTTAKTIFTELFNRRLDYLAAFAETAAKDYGLKQVFNDDTRSLLVALNNHRKRIDADLVMAVSAKGIITGQLQRHFLDGASSTIKQGVERGTAFRFASWLESGQPAHLYTIDDAIYQLSLSPVVVGSKTLGWIAFGFQIDQRLATEFMNITNLTTDFVVKYDGMWRLIAASDKKVVSSQELLFAESIIEGSVPEYYIATHSLITEFDEQEFGVVMHRMMVRHWRGKRINLSHF